MSKLSKGEDGRRMTKLGAQFVACILSVCGLVLGLELPASAGGTYYTWGPGVGGYVKVESWTLGKTGTSERLRVHLESGRFERGNRCTYGMSIWYTAPNGSRQNSYVDRNGCTGGPVFWFWSPALDVKRGTSVQVTFRAEGQWYSGVTFRSE